MKIYNYVILVIATIFLSCQNQKKSEITISGVIKGEIPDALEYTVPVDETCFWGFKDSITPDAKGTFNIKMPIAKTTFIKLRILGQSDVTLIAEPGKNYVVNFDLTKEDKMSNFEIGGDDAKVQKIYNALPYPIHIQDAAEPFLVDTTSQQIVSKIKKLKAADLAQFDLLLKKDSISRTMYDFIKLDREYYYTATQGTVAFMKFLINERKIGAFNPDIKNMWEKTFENDLISRSDFQKTNWGYALAENFLFYKGYEKFSFDNEKFRNSLAGNSYLQIFSTRANKHLPPNVLKNFIAIFLYMELLQKDYQAELIALYDDFKTSYPDNSYNTFLSPMIAEVIHFQEVASQSFDKDIAIVADYENVDSFDKLLSKFKGKKVYIDIWGTWCAPCKEEFKHKTALKKLMDEKEVETLYICESRSSKKENWKNMIKFYDLKGHHLMANKKLMADIIASVSTDGSFYYPWYILVDENGLLIEKNASKPSELDKLEKELNSTNSI